MLAGVPGSDVPPVGNWRATIHRAQTDAKTKLNSKCGSSSVGNACDGLGRREQLCRTRLHGRREGGEVVQNDKACRRGRAVEVVIDRVCRQLCCVLAQMEKHGLLRASDLRAVSLLRSEVKRMMLPRLYAADTDFVQEVRLLAQIGMTLLQRHNRLPELVVGSAEHVRQGAASLSSLCKVLALAPPRSPWHSNLSEFARSRPEHLHREDRRPREPDAEHSHRLAHALGLLALYGCHRSAKAHLGDRAPG